MEAPTFRLRCLVCNPTQNSIALKKHRICSAKCYEIMTKTKSLFLKYKEHLDEKEPKALSESLQQISIRESK